MKRNYIGKSLCWLGAGLLLLTACKDRKAEYGEHSMPDIAADTSIAHLLRPVNEHVISALPVITAQRGPMLHNVSVEGVVTFDTRNERSLSSRVAGRIERLYVKYNYQPVKQGQLIMEIYSPDLVAAQRELLLISRSSDADGMLAAARQRLQLLGMSSAQISRVLKTGEVMYRVPVYSNVSGYILEKATQAAPPAPAPSSTAAAGGGMSGMGGGGMAPMSDAPATASRPVNSPVLLREGQYVGAGQSLFTVYQAGGLLAELYLRPGPGAYIGKGTRVLLEDAMQSGQLKAAVIGLVQPVINEGERFTQARVYLKDKSYRAGQLIQAHIPLVIQNSWWLPREALVSLGNSSVVFRREGRAFVPVEVETGLQAGNNVQILTEIGGWEVAAKAYYLTDRESFIQAKK